MWSEIHSTAQLSAWPNYCAQMRPNRRVRVSGFNNLAGGVVVFDPHRPYQISPEFEEIKNRRSVALLLREDGSAVGPPGYCDIKHAHRRQLLIQWSFHAWLREPVRTRPHWHMRQPPAPVRVGFARRFEKHQMRKRGWRVVAEISAFGHHVAHGAGFQRGQFSFANAS